MCLYIGKNQPEIAKNDIVCYKVVKAYGGKYYTTFMNYPLTSYRNMIGYKLIDTNLDCIHKCIQFNFCGQFILCGGVIHTFKNVADTKFGYHINSRDHIFKCIIPKGTEYIKGSSCLCRCIESYGSKSIRFVERIV